MSTIGTSGTAQSKRCSPAEKAWAVRLVRQQRKVFQNRDCMRGSLGRSDMALREGAPAPSA